MTKLKPPTYFDPEYLYEKYEPLRKAVFARSVSKMSSSSDRQDLVGIIDEIFFQLVREFNPHMGVDFPYYIKKMLGLRVYHQITKHLKVVNTEYCSENDLLIEDSWYEDIYDKIVDLNSMDPNIKLGDKHRQLLINTVIHKKTLQEQAKEEGVPIDRLHARMYFLRQKFEDEYENQKNKYGDDMY